MSLSVPYKAQINKGAEYEVFGLAQLVPAFHPNSKPGKGYTMISKIGIACLVMLADYTLMPGPAPPLDQQFRPTPDCPNPPQICWDQEFGRLAWIKDRSPVIAGSMNYFLNCRMVFYPCADPSYRH